MKKINVFQMVFCAVMAALSIVLEKFASIDLGPFKLTMYGLPLILVGVLYGSKLGLLTGFIAGCVMQLTSEYGITLTSVFWALAPIAWGGVSGILFERFRFKKTIISVVLTITIASLCATFLNTIAMFCEMWLISDEYYNQAMIFTNLPVRIISSIILIIPYSIVTEAVRKVLSTIYIRK